jgi:hypothetical protein
MATIAVFVALGGSSYAALVVTGKNVRNNSLTTQDIRNNSLTTQDIRNNSLTTEDVRNNSLTTSDVRNRSLLSEDFKPGQLPAGPAGRTGAQGPQGDPGAPGTARAFVHVIDGPAVTATVDVANSKGVSAANITHTETGAFYCFHDLGFTPQSVIVSSDLASPSVADESQVALGNQGMCSPNPEQVTVRTADNDANLDGGFWLLIN